MTSNNTDTENDVAIKIRETLVSINDITVKIKKELEAIEELVKKDGHLHTVVNTANLTLSKKVQEMGMNVDEIISQSKHNDKLDPNLLSSITSVEIIEKLLEHKDS